MRLSWLPRPTRSELKKAEADCEAARLQGEGIAKQREAIVDGLKRSVTSGTDETLPSDKVSELLLITQYFETLKEIGAHSKSNAVFIPHQPAVGDISSQIATASCRAHPGRCACELWKSKRRAWR